MLAFNVYLELHLDNPIYLEIMRSISLRLQTMKGLILVSLDNNDLDKQLSKQKDFILFCRFPKKDNKKTL